MRTRHTRRDPRTTRYRADWPARWQVAETDQGVFLTPIPEYPHGFGNQQLLVVELGEWLSRDAENYAQQLQGLGQLWEVLKAAADTDLTAELRREPSGS